MATRDKIREAIKARNERILQLYAAGEGVTEISRGFSMSRGGVHKVLASAGAIKVRAYDGPPIKRARLSPEQIERSAPRPVMRDPCPRCGVRGDVGCAHRQPVPDDEPWTRPVGIDKQIQGDV